jgi:2-iminobutanoate/2-iminopropanoate deaminase
MKKIETTTAPAAIGPYSQAIVAGDFLYCSGQIPLDPGTGNMVSGGIAEQTRQCLGNLRKVLIAAGVDFSHVVKTTIYLADMADFAIVNEIYAEYCSDPAPARATVQVAALPKGALIEIDAVAFRGN